MYDKIRKNDIVYYARIMPKLGIYDVHDLKVRSTEDTYFVGVDVRSKHSFIFSYKDIASSRGTNNKSLIIESPSET